MTPALLWCLVVMSGAPLAGARQLDDLPGMPPLVDARDVYAGARAGQLSPVVAGYPDRVYVPNSGRNTVDVIDPHTFTIVGHFPAGRQPQHVVPSYDLKTLWVLNDLADSLSDGRVLWLSGRYHAEVYAFDTSDGHLLARVRVGKGPHGLCVYPQPGRYSLGHTGNMR